MRVVFLTTPGQIEIEARLVAGISVSPHEVWVGVIPEGLTVDRIFVYGENMVDIRSCGHIVGTEPPRKPGAAGIFVADHGILSLKGKPLLEHNDSGQYAQVALSILTPRGTLKRSVLLLYGRGQFIEGISSLGSFMFDPNGIIE